MQNQPRIALCYLRQTTVGSASDQALEQERIRLLRVCEAQGWEPEWYEDVNQRGRSVAGLQQAAKRRAWQALQQRLDSPDVIALVVSDYTRISRSVSELSEILTKLEEKGVKVVKAK